MEKPLILTKRHESLLTSVVWIMLILMIPTLIGYKLDHRLFNGINVWIKPFKFELSLSIYFGTLAWFSVYVDRKFSSLKRWKWMVGAASLSALFEIGYIFFRAARAEGSHYNETTLIAAIMHTFMGLGALILVAFTFWLGTLILRSKETPIPASIRLAIGLGLIATGLLGGFTGIYISMNNSPWLGGGDLRLPHTLGLHAMQGIPLIGWISTKIGIHKPAFFIWGVFVAWSLLTTLLFYQTLQGT